jgi:hypothetical protein
MRGRALVALVLVTCGACGSHGGGGAFDAPSGGGDAPAIDAAHPLAVTPASARIDVVDGVAQPATFTASVDGAPVTATWSVSRPFVAVDAQGRVTASGELGGPAIVTATYLGQTATATVEVHVRETLDPGGASAAQEALLRAATAADPATGWQYPYDHTVFPRGLPAPELMWRGGAAGDLVLAHYVTDYVDVELFAKATSPARLALDAAPWRALSESGHGGALALTVARLPAGAAAATRLVAQTWTIAPGRLPGWIYYFQSTTSIGTTVRLAPGAAAPDDFLARAGATSNCVACHAISADGTTMIDGGDYPGSTFDLVANKFVFSVTSINENTRQWGAPAVTGDGRALVQNAAPTPVGGYGIDGLWDSHSGARLAQSGLDGPKYDQPRFSRDGRHLVFVDHTTGALAQMDFDPATQRASNRVDLLQVGGGDPIRRPSYSADGAMIVYARGALDTRVGPSDLYALRLGAGGGEVRLAALDGDATTFDAGARDQHLNYMPHAAVLEAGGYQWVAFTSRRTYGNRLTAASGSTKQLWIAAIDPTITTGDPSAPAFYLTGQMPTLRNWDPDWALPVCAADGATCALGSDCCSRSCAAGVCAEPVAGACAADDDGCGSATDCCTAGARCVNGFCSAPR